MQDTQNSKFLLYMSFFPICPFFFPVSPIFFCIFFDSIEIASGQIIHKLLKPIQMSFAVYLCSVEDLRWNDEGNVLDMWTPLLITEKNVSSLQIDTAVTPPLLQDAFSRSSMIKSCSVTWLSRLEVVFLSRLLREMGSREVCALLAGSTEFPWSLCE